MAKRLVYLCDWLPPDFGAVGQYALLEAREWARRGFAVTLVGLTSRDAERGPLEQVGDGSVEIIRVHRHSYQKHRFLHRLVKIGDDLNGEGYAELTLIENERDIKKMPHPIEQILQEVLSGREVWPDGDEF